MKTYGQIGYEAKEEYYAKYGEAPLKGNPRKWEDNPTDLAKGASEACAQAVIEEFKRRHGIVITPEED